MSDDSELRPALIYSVIILLGGMILTGLTLGFFSLIGLEIYNFYTEYIIVLGLVSSPIVATYLYDNIFGESKISILISNVFSPLFLVTAIVYLLAVLYQGGSPYLDREFLIIFNGLLIITVFSISGVENFGRGNFGSASDLTYKISMPLVSVALIINASALSAIVLLLTEYGVTPNSIGVTGANIFIFIYLSLILRAYISYRTVQLILYDVYLDE